VATLGISGIAGDARAEQEDGPGGCQDWRPACKSQISRQAHAVFDTPQPEEWRFLLRLLDARSADDPLPRVLEREGELRLEPEVELGGGD
jgi:hypothetical protein